MKQTPRLSMCLNHDIKTKGSKLGKKAYAISNCDTELLSYWQSSVTALSVLNTFILLLTSLLSISRSVSLYIMI